MKLETTGELRLGDSRRLPQRTEPWPFQVKSLPFDT